LTRVGFQHLLCTLLASRLFKAHSTMTKNYLAIRGATHRGIPGLIGAGCLRWGGLPCRPRTSVHRWEGAGGWAGCWWRAAIWEGRRRSLDRSSAEAPASTIAVGARGGVETREGEGGGKARRLGVVRIWEGWGSAVSCHMPLATPWVGGVAGLTTPNQTQGGGMRVWPTAAVPSGPPAAHRRRARRCMPPGG